MRTTVPQGRGNRTGRQKQGGQKQAEGRREQARSRTEAGPRDKTILRDKTGQRPAASSEQDPGTAPRGRRSRPEIAGHESPARRPIAPRTPVSSPPAVVTETPVRLQKLLADAGFGSRREIERWIEQGRVTVDGQPAQLGLKVSPGARILIDGKPVVTPPKYSRSRVLLLNKAPGTICTRTDPEGRPTVFEDLPDIRRGRWVVVGRLDAMTSGLLLFTDDGELANRLMHPSSMLDREYAVRVDGTLGDAEIATLRAGVTVEGEAMRFTDLRYYDGRGRNHWYHAVLMEGKQHEVRLLFAAVGRVVSRLKRVRFGPVALPSRLAAGRYEELGDADVATLRRLVGLDDSGPVSVRSERRKTVLLQYPELADRKGRSG